MGGCGDGRCGGAGWLIPTLCKYAGLRHDFVIPIARAQVVSCFHILDGPIRSIDLIGDLLTLETVISYIAILRHIGIIQEK